MFPSRAIRVGIIGLGVGRWHIESYHPKPKSLLFAILTKKSYDYGIIAFDINYLKKQGGTI